MRGGGSKEEEELEEGREWALGMHFEGSCEVGWSHSVGWRVHEGSKSSSAIAFMLIFIAQDGFIRFSHRILLFSRRLCYKFLYNAQ